MPLPSLAVQNPSTDVQDEALEDLRAEAAEFVLEEFEVGQDTKIVDLDMQIFCAFRHENDMLKFKLKFGLLA